MTFSSAGQDPRPMPRASIGEILHLLNSAFRRNIVRCLLEGERDVGTVAAILKKSSTRVSQELREFRTVRVVEFRCDKSRKVYGLSEHFHAYLDAGVLHVDLAVATKADELILNLHGPAVDAIPDDESKAG